MENKELALQKATEICKYFEGFSSKPYICPAGVPTIGYGTVYKPDGTKVTMQHMAISKDTATQWLMFELEHNYMANVLKAQPHLIKFPNVLAATTQFTYNLGVAVYRGSTLRRRINECNWRGAKEQLMRWTRGNGKVLPGLVKRRKTEQLLLPNQ